MLRQIPLHPTSQTSTEYTKHWFQNEYFDLFLWLTVTGQIKSFQLCYNRSQCEAVLVWDNMQGFSFHGVDDGEFSPNKNMTPVFTKPKNKPDPALISRFEHDSAQLAPEIRSFLVHKLSEFFTLLS